MFNRDADDKPSVNDKTKNTALAMGKILGMSENFNKQTEGPLLRLPSSDQTRTGSHPPRECWHVQAGQCRWSDVRLALATHMGLPGVIRLSPIALTFLKGG